MRNKVKAIFATLLILTSLSMTAASTADLNIFPKEATAPIDSYASYQVEVENTGPVKDHYSMLTSSTEVTAEPSSFYLDSGETEEVYVWYDPEVQKDAGSYSFEVTAQSRATSEKYSVTGIANVVKEHEVSVSLDDSRTVCRGGNANYDIEVTNEGIQPETFELTTDYGDLSQNTVKLEEGETQVVTLTASSDKALERSFNVVAASTTSYAQDIQRVSFVSEACYSSEVSVTPGSQEVAAFNTATFDVTISNKGTRDDTFVLETSGGELTENQVEVEAGETRDIGLEYTPRELNDKEFTVTADGESQASETVSLSVYNGNDVELELDDKSRSVCETGEFSYEAKISNTGEADDSYNLTVDRGELSTDTVSIEEGETEEVDVLFNSEDFSEGDQKSFRLTAQSETFEEPRKTANGNFNVQNCWDLDMNVVPEVKSTGDNMSTVYEIKLNNTGIKENTYELTYEGPSWIDIRPETVTVPAGEMETAYIYASIPFQKKGEVRITATAVGSDVQKSETVKLVIGKEIEEAIKSGEEPQGLTGMFQGRASDLVDTIQSSDAAFKLLISIIVSAAIVGFILYRG